MLLKNSPGNQLVLTDREKNLSFSERLFGRQAGPKHLPNSPAKCSPNTCHTAEVCNLKSSHSKCLYAPEVCMEHGNAWAI